jgi:hypothetical protein
MRSMVYIVGILTVILAFSAEAKTIFEVPDNIVENPSAEEIAGNMPYQWGSYVGNGTFEMGFTDEESHSGEYSAYLIVLGSDDNDKMNGSILAADSNGYVGATAYECEENTEYFYAFYAKAEDHTDFEQPLRVLLWCWKAGATSDDRVFPPAARITLTSEWTRYEGSFVTPEGAETFALGIGPSAVEAAEIEAMFYLDDVYLGLTPPPPDPEAVDASDKLAAKWGEIKLCS